MKAIVSFYNPDGWAAAYSQVRSARVIKVLTDRSAVWMIPNTIVATADGTFTFEIEGELIDRHDVMSIPLTVGLVKVVDGEEEIERKALNRLVFYMVLASIGLLIWWIFRRSI